jgi:hypothetical protein
MEWRSGADQRYVPGAGFWLERGSTHTNGQRAQVTGLARKDATRIPEISGL